MEREAFTHAPGTSDTASSGVASVAARTERSFDWARQLGMERWGHRTPTLQGLCFRFGVRCTDPVLGRYVDSILTPLRSPVPAAHWYSLVAYPGGPVDIFLEASRLTRAADWEAAVGWLMWDINRAVVDASGQHLLLHAGGVEARDGGVLIPGESGSGKTTLVAGLVRAGLGYLSDEVMAVTTSGATLLPYPKALVVEEGSFEALSGLRPSRALVTQDPASFTGSPSQWYVTPSDIRPGAAGRACGASVVVVPRYEHGARSALTPLSPKDAFTALATNTLNLERHGALGMQVLAELVGHCDCYRLVSSDLDSACRLVLGLLEERS